MTVLEQAPAYAGVRPVPLCEIIATQDFARRKTFGHWGGADNGCSTPFCACDIPPESIASRIGDERAERLVNLLVKFAYSIHTPEEQAEMLALITEGKP